jgi:hypothetical protein
MHKCFFANFSVHIFVFRDYFLLHLSIANASTDLMPQGHMRVLLSNWQLTRPRFLDSIQTCCSASIGVIVSGGITVCDMRILGLG